jgi:phosphoribosylamine--glycine ligase
MVLEFNARFGDPDIEVVLPRLEGDLLRLLLAAAHGKLSDAPVTKFDPKACVGVVMASEGYPQISQPLNRLPLFAASGDESTIGFWGASRLVDGGVNVSGGRVLTVCALGNDMNAARSRAYEAVKLYQAAVPAGAGLRYRSDIATRLVSALR